MSHRLSRPLRDVEHGALVGRKRRQPEDKGRHVGRALALLCVGPLAGCINSTPPESDTQMRSAVSVPPIAQFFILARRGVTMGDRASESGGSIGVSAGSGTPANTFSVGFDGHVAIGKVIVAPKVVVQARTTVGNLDANQITATGATTGTRAPFQAPPTTPSPGPVTAGTTPISVPVGQSLTLIAGQYGAVAVSGTLNLAGGIYQIASLSLDNDAKVVANASSVVRVAGGVTALDRVHVVPAGALHARDLRLEVAGAASSGTGLQFGTDAQLTAVTVAQLAFRAADRLTATGALAADQVTMGNDPHLTFDGGFACASNSDCSGGACVAGSCTDSGGIACQASQVARLPLDPGKPFDLASDGTSLFWTDPTGGTLRSAALNGSNPKTIVTGRPNGPVGLVVDDSFVYFADTLEGSVSRVPKAGGAPVIIAYNQRGPRFLVNDGDHLLWTNQGTGHGDGSVRQYTKSTGHLDVLANTQAGPWMIATAAGRAYWSDVVSGAVSSRATPADSITTVASGLRAATLAAGAAAHILSADGRLFDVDATSGSASPRAASPAGAFFATASDPSVFWTNGIQQSVVEHGSANAFPFTIWRRSGDSAPRTVRAFGGTVFFSVTSQTGPSSIFSFVPDAAPPVIAGGPACAPGLVGPACDHTTGPITPFLECVFETTDHRLIAHFGYTNADKRLTRRVGVGPENQVDRGDGDACQPTTFAVGTHHDAFAVGFVDEVTWQVGSRSATASRSSARCAPGAVRPTEVLP